MIASSFQLLINSQRVSFTAKWRQNAAGKFLLFESLLVALFCCWHQSDFPFCWRLSPRPSAHALMWTANGHVHVIVESGCGWVCFNFRFITCDCNWIRGTSRELQPLLNPWESWLKEGTVSKIIVLILSARITVRLWVCRLHLKNPRPRVRIYRWTRLAAEGRVQMIRLMQHLQTCGCCDGYYRRKTCDDSTVILSLTHRMHSGYINVNKIKAVERNQKTGRRQWSSDLCPKVQTLCFWMFLTKTDTFIWF